LINQARHENTNVDGSGDGLEKLDDPGGSADASNGVEALRKRRDAEFDRSTIETKTILNNTEKEMRGLRIKTRGITGKQASETEDEASEPAGEQVSNHKNRSLMNWSHAALTADAGNNYNEIDYYDSGDEESVAEDFAGNWPHRDYHQSNKVLRI
jgi:hypothetical protein